MEEQNPTGAKPYDANNIPRLVPNSKDFDNEVLRATQETIARIVDAGLHERLVSQQLDISMQIARGSDDEERMKELRHTFKAIDVILKAYKDMKTGARIGETNKRTQETAEQR